MSFLPIVFLLRSLGRIELAMSLTVGIRSTMSRVACDVEVCVRGDDRAMRVGSCLGNCLVRCSRATGEGLGIQWCVLAANLRRGLQGNLRGGRQVPLRIQECGSTSNLSLLFGFTSKIWKA